ncbi:hypothetical protein [Pseudovibrio sp. SCP19]|uniref:hypothetical protein n=1 Tax=Pseudovibrio sp. SCP19 TaxID=3141374 RepID=UPI00333B5CE4
MRSNTFESAPEAAFWGVGSKLRFSPPRVAIKRPPLFASLLRWLVVLVLLTAGVFFAGLSARAQIILTVSPLGVLYVGLNMVHSFNAED